MKNKLVLMILSIVMLLGFSNIPASMENTAVNKTDDFYVGEMLDENHVFTTIDKDGNIIEMDIEAMEKEVALENEAKKNIPENAGNTTVIEAGIVNFRTKESALYNTSYTDVNTGKSGYTNGYYAADGAFLGYNDDATKVKFMLAGVVGWVNTSEVEVLEYDDETVKSISHYMAEKGKFYHYGTVNMKQQYYSMVTRVGNTPSYLKENTPYYSYDGHYFYEDYETMVSDYKKDSRQQAINANTPYYNYYQYLSHRTTTNFTEEMFDSYVEEKTSGKSSKMADLGEVFIDVQDTYGVNAALMYAVAVNESAWGLSNIAQTKNNLFGHGAVDSNPLYGSNGYETPSDSVLYHGRDFISVGYLDPCDYRDTQGQGFCDSLCLLGRYAGPHLGDKASGVNVQYASDPYWGEKASTVLWNLDDKNTTAKDSSKYTLGIKNMNGSLNVRKEANASSTRLYATGSFSSIPFVVLSEKEGSAVNGNKVWYKIQSDATLSADRSVITQDIGTYDFENYYGYVHSEYVDIVHEGTYNEDPFDMDAFLVALNLEVKNNYFYGIDVKTTPEAFKNKVKNIDASVEVSVDCANTYISTGTKITFKASDGTTLSHSVVIKGDVNGDGNIFATDYVLIKNHIMGVKTLTGIHTYAADVNGDTKIYATDYVLIKNYIMGKGTL